MQEKILAQLKQSKGTNSVSERTLEEQAQLLASLITTDEQLNAYDFAKHVNTLGGNISHDVAEQARIAKEELEKKYVKTDQSKQDPTKQDPPKPDNMPEWAKDLLEQNKQNAEMLAKMQGEKITNARTQELNELLKDAPKAYKEQVFAGFEKMNFSDDDDFGSFKESTKTNFESFKQMAKEQGVVFNTPGVNVQKPANDGQDATLSAAAKLVADAKKKEE